MGAIREELYNLKAFILETLIATPINKTKTTIYKPNPLNINPKLVIIA